MKSYFKKTICLLVCGALSVSYSCKYKSCSSLPDKFKSYGNALNEINSTDFPIEDSCDTSNSSWIVDAEFFSCDTKSGILVITTSKETYLYKNVPKSIWNGFVKAESKGKYYNMVIRYKYFFPLNQ